LVVFPYYRFDVCTVCSDVPCFISNIGNLHTLFSLLVLLDYCHFYWSFYKALLFFSDSNFKAFHALSFFLLLLALCLFCSAIPMFLRWEVRLLIWDFSLFVMYSFSAVNFPLYTALSMSHEFWYMVYLIFIQFNIFFISFESSSWPIDYLELGCLFSTCLDICCYLSDTDFSLIALWLENTLCIILIPLNLSKFILAMRYRLSWYMFQGIWKKCVFSCWVECSIKYLFVDGVVEIFYILAIF